MGYCHFKVEESTWARLKIGRINMDIFIRESSDEGFRKADR